MMNSLLSNDILDLFVDFASSQGFTPDSIITRNTDPELGIDIVGGTNIKCQAMFLCERTKQWVTLGLDGAVRSFKTHQVLGA